MPPGPTFIRAVVFDLDDTLYPERDYVRSGYRAAASYLRQMLGRGEAFEDWLWCRFQAACAGEDFLPGFSGGAFDALNVRFDLGLKPSQIAELVRVYREHRPNIRPFGETPYLLGRLHEQVGLGLLSDGFLPAQRLKFEALGLTRFFDEVIFTEELGREAWKPSPAGFERIARLLGVPHDACAYVADNPAKDFLAANRLGWRTVQFLQLGQIHAHKPAPPGGEARFRVRAIDGLADVLKQGAPTR